MTARSLIVSYSLGVVLTFLTVTFSSWRIGNLNIVSAIRDMPESTVAEERPLRASGFRGVRLVRALALRQADAPAPVASRHRPLVLGGAARSRSRACSLFGAITLGTERSPPAPALCS